MPSPFHEADMGYAAATAIWKENIGRQITPPPAARQAKSDATRAVSRTLACLVPSGSSNELPTGLYLKMSSTRYGEPGPAKKVPSR